MASALSTVRTVSALEYALLPAATLATARALLQSQTLDRERRQLESEQRAKSPALRRAVLGRREALAVLAIGSGGWALGRSGAPSTTADRESNDRASDSSAILGDLERAKAAEAEAQRQLEAAREELRAREETTS